VDPQALFAIAFPLAVPFWALMILVPGWAWTRRVISSPLIVVPPLLVYVVLLVPQFAAFAGPVASADLPGVTAVLGTTAGAAAIWAHAIGFDLFVGRWMYLDSRERGVAPLVMAPLFVLTILLSPLGLLAYLLLRTLLRASRPDEPAVIADPARPERA
jgi:Domain of unknown function (DUF4281)